MMAGERSEVGRFTQPDTPPVEEDTAAGEPPAGGSQGNGDDPDAPPVATTGSEATRTVAGGTGAETGEARIHRGDTVDGSEGSATGSRTAGS